MGFVVSLILIGLVLIFAEIMLIPGVGVAGILGLLSMGGSCYYAFYEFGSTTGGIVTGVNGLLLLLLTIYVLRAKTWKRFLFSKKVKLSWNAHTINENFILGKARITYFPFGRMGIIK